MSAGRYRQTDNAGNQLSLCSRLVTRTASRYTNRIKFFTTYNIPMQNPGEYYSRQYNARAAIPDHPYIFTRWVKESAHARRTNAALLDIAYGEASGERLDFFPANRGGAPLLIFIHGGWWRSLDKADFSFVAGNYVRAGFNVALTNYTLAPAAPIAEIVRQQLRAGLVVPPSGAIRLRCATHRGGRTFRRRASRRHDDGRQVAATGTGPAGGPGQGWHPDVRHF
jgi:hypothetical protein